MALSNHLEVLKRDFQNFYFFCPILAPFVMKPVEFETPYHDNEESYSNAMKIVEAREFRAV